MAPLQHPKHRIKLCERWLILFSLDGKAHCMEQRYNSGSLALISESRFAAGCLCRLRLAESRSWQVWTPLRESRNVVHPGSTPQLTQTSMLQLAGRVGRCLMPRLT